MQAVRTLASLKFAIPLLIILIAVTVVGSLFPQADVFSADPYLILLGLLGVSLLLVTLIHIPAILHKKGRKTLAGVIVTHLGILVLIGAVIYGNYSGFRYTVKLIEGEVTVVPGIPFVIQLDQLTIEEYNPSDFPRVNLQALPKKQQLSAITLLERGKAVLTTTASPGNPVKFKDITLLPSISDVGWYFELVITDPQGREKSIPVKPWSPPLIQLGDRRVLTHNILVGNVEKAELFTIETDAMVSLGFADKAQPLMIDGYSVMLGSVKRYTGMQVYNRPQETLLVIG
ncbi:MAG: cytochrome c biogenesis protein ResB, partial [Gammaproteobacteria bacterium]|nr:cytochrome c biogenesis protein ResB [Gammaproteobacteria bacterium]